VAKRQATKTGIGVQPSCPTVSPRAAILLVQAICDRLGPGRIRVFAERWWSICRCRSLSTTAPPAIGGAVDAPGGDLAHVGVDAPRHAPRFFEALVTDNLDIGRPEP